MQRPVASDIPWAEQFTLLFLQLFTTFAVCSITSLQVRWPPLARDARATPASLSHESVTSKNLNISSCVPCDDCPTLVLHAVGLHGKSDQTCMHIDYPTSSTVRLRFALRWGVSSGAIHFRQRHWCQLTGFYSANTKLQLQINTSTLSALVHNTEAFTNFKKHVKAVHSDYSQRK